MGFGGLVVGVAALIGALAGDGERITAHWASARVGADGTAQVTEVLDYDFGPNDRRGIFRDVPALNPAAPITVESATAPDDISIEPFSAETRIRIGDPAITISGRHRYTIAYPIGVLFGDRISWNAVGGEWPVGIANAELHLLADTDLVDPECSAGSLGTVGGCEAIQVEPGHLLVRIDSLDSFEGVTISATRGDPLTAAPTVDPPAPGVVDDPGTGVLLPAGLAAGFAAVAAGLVSPFVRRAGREQVWAGGVADAAFGSQFGEDEYAIRLADQSELKEMASIEFAPPRGLTAWQGGIIHDEAVTKDHQVAWLLDRAIAGEVGVAGQGKDLTLSRAPVDSPEAAMLDQLFDGRRTVELGEYDKRFAAGWKALGEHLEEWHQASGFWDPDGDRRKTIARVVGALFLIIGIGTALAGAVVANRTGITALALVIVGAVAAGGGLGLLIRSWELRVRTARGSGLWILIESFRTFIDQSDSRHVEAAAQQGRLLEYTAWAAALGEVDHWASRISEANLPSGTIHPGHLYLAAAAPSISSAVSKASTAPSSSGGGGGGVGGGGGGGGGGSW
ncbi:MAG: DUF2207 domain-containing protein [Actinomycetota bacterium]